MVRGIHKLVFVSRPGYCRMSTKITAIRFSCCHSRRESAFASAGLHLERTLPSPGFSTEIFQKCGSFLEEKNHHPKTTLPPAIHHKFTTRNHHKTTRFLKNPLKKRPSATLEKIYKTNAPPQPDPSASTQTLPCRR